MLEGLGMRQENTEMDVFEEYVTVLSFELSQWKLCVVEIMLRANG